MAKKPKPPSRKGLPPLTVPGDKPFEPPDPRKLFPFDQAIADVIVQRLIDGESLRRICKDEGMPSKGTVLSRWVKDNPAFADQYAQARIDQAETFVDEIADISDDGSNDWMERELENGLIVEVPNHEHMQRSRLRVETRKWIASKMKPKVYGEQSKINLEADLKHEHSGASLDAIAGLLQTIVTDRAAAPSARAGVEPAGRKT